MVVTERTQVPGRGTILLAKLDKGEEPPSLSSEVEFEGKWWRITGVEQSRTLMYPGTVKPEVGLIVKEVRRG